MKDKLLQVAAVSYLNTVPLLYGFIYHPINKSIQVSKSNPSQLVKQFKRKEVDVALLPVAALTQLDSYNIVSNICIGCTQAVATVQIFSHVKWEHIHTIYLDPQSVSSVALLRVLLQEKWKRNDIQLMAAPRGYEIKCAAGEAALIIGDRATFALKNYKYAYDLGAAWNELTHLPFAFAVWVSREPMSEAWQKEFDEAMYQGLEAKEKIAHQYNYFNHHKFSVLQYWNQNISYTLDQAKREAIKLFLDKITALPPLNLTSALANEHSIEDENDLELG